MSASPALKRDDDLGMAEAFGRDPLLHVAMHDLVKRYKIHTVVETGTWRGYTTRAFAEFTPFVWTIDNDISMTREAAKTLCDLENVRLGTEDSGEWIKKYAHLLETPILFWLDAHWRKDWPLFRELEGIVAHRKPCVIAIHDCQVPLHPELGYDTYNGDALTFELVEYFLDHLEFSWRHYFNSHALGHKRGVLFVVPEEWD